MYIIQIIKFGCRLQQRLLLYESDELNIEFVVNDRMKAKSRTLWRMPVHQLKYHVGALKIHGERSLEIKASTS